MNPPAHFVRSVAANVAHWLQRAARFDTLDRDRDNIFRAVQFGLSLPETWAAASELAIQLFEFVEVNGYWWDWITTLEKAIENCPQEDLGMRCRLLNRLGFLYRLDERNLKALETHKMALAIAERAGDAQETFYTHFFLSGDYYTSHQYAEAERHGLSALEGFTGSGEVGGEYIATLNILGMVAHAKGDYLAAEERFTRAITLWRGQPFSTTCPGRSTWTSRPKLAQTLNNLAITLQAQNKFEDALARLTEALTLLNDTSSKLAQTNTQISLGSLYFAMKRLREAETTFRQIEIAFLQEAGHTYYLAVTANNLGNVLLERGRFWDAETYLRDSVALWREINYPLMLANTLGDLGKTLVKQGNGNAAIPPYDEGIAILTTESGRPNYSDDAWVRKRLKELTAQREQAWNERIGKTG
ncbi:MAG: tetratricopeptide repeat protein [Anaerolineales bacterium]